MQGACSLTCGSLFVACVQWLFCSVKVHCVQMTTQLQTSGTVCAVARGLCVHQYGSLCDVSQYVTCCFVANVLLSSTPGDAYGSILMAQSVFEMWCFHVHFCYLFGTVGAVYAVSPSIQS